MTTSHSQAEGFAKFIEFLRDDHKRTEKRRAELAELVQTIPVPDEVLNRISWPFQEVLCHHPGYSAEHSLRTLQAALDLFDQSHRDLVSQLNAFNTFSSTRGFGSRAKRIALDSIHLKVRKELLAFSSAAASLVDHARRVSAALPINDLEVHRARYFDHQEHQFVIDLRNLISHGRFPSTSWQVNYVPTRSTDFVLFSKDLLHSGELRSDSRKYLQRIGDQVHVRRLADSYIGKVHPYYEWYRASLENSLPLSVRDYRRCERVCRSVSARSGYKLILTEVLRRKVDPYPHLDKYLMPDELDAANRFSHRSREQIDYIISVADEHQACDDELRTLIYRIFDVNPQ